MKSLSIALAALALPLLACGASATLPPAHPADGAPAALPADSQDPVPAGETQASAFDALHAPWTALLAKHVRGGDFDYAGLAKDRAGLDAYVMALEAVKPDAFAALSRKEQFAFWINAYNAYTVKRVVDAYPVKSIRDLGDEKLSVWDRELVPLGRLFPKLGREKLTLNDVENRILRPTFLDARLHAAINCAAKGCPVLRAEAYTSAKLDAQLDEQVKLWLTDASRNRFDRAKSTAEISRIFEWFAEDFQREAGSVRAWIARYRPDDRDWLAPLETAEKKVDVKYVEYDWALNAAKP